MDEWLITKGIIPEQYQKDFFCGATFVIKGRATLNEMRREYPARRQERQSLFVRKEYHIHTQKGLIVFGLTRNGGDTFIYYQRTKKCRLVTRLRRECGYINIGPDGVSKFTQDYPLHLH